MTLNLDRLLIDPDPREAKEAKEWLRYQGDMRGFIAQDGEGPEYLIIFDSYGATHTTCAIWINAEMSRHKAISTHLWDSLIFRLDGSILSDSSCKIEEWPERIQKFIRNLYAPVKPWINLTD